MCPLPGIEVPLDGVTLGADVEGLPPVGRLGMLGVAIDDFPTTTG